MNDFAKPGDHGLVRTDFPGGWDGDKINAFLGIGLSEDQKEMQNYVKKLLNFRKTSKAIHTGKTIHFAPENGVYVLCRKFEAETVVFILNKNENSVVLDLDRFKEIALEGRTLQDPISGENIVWKSELTLKAQGSKIFTTKSK
jgi:glycosidase